MSLRRSFRPTDGFLLGGTIAVYFDPSSQCRFVVAEPAQQPELWRAYLAGAATSYGKHGVASVLEYDRTCDGRSTAIFFAALDEMDSVVGGMRVQGRYRDAREAHALEEWAGREGTDRLRDEIEDRLPDGVIEMKTGWVSDSVTHRHHLTNALARIFVHSLRLMDARYALGTVAEHAVRRWQTTGGVVSADVAPVAYPDPSYRTVPMWWDAQTFADLTDPEQLPLILREVAQIDASAQRRPLSEITA